MLPLLEVAIGRLEDKANAVRKSAIHLLIVLLQFNPYHAKLSLPFFEEKVKSVKQLLSVSIPYRAVYPNSLFRSTRQKHSEMMTATQKYYNFFFLLNAGLRIFQVAKQKLQAVVLGTPYEAIVTDVFGTHITEHLKAFERWAMDAAEFVSVIEKAVPLVCQLLGSKNTSDVLEAIQFFVAAKEFALQNAQVILSLW